MALKFRPDVSHCIPVQQAAEQTDLDLLILNRVRGFGLGCQLKWLTSPDRPSHDTVDRLGERSPDGSSLVIISIGSRLQCLAFRDFT